MREKQRHRTRQADRGRETALETERHEDRAGTDTDSKRSAMAIRSYGRPETPDLNPDRFDQTCRSAPA